MKPFGIPNIRFERIMAMAGNEQYYNFIYAN